MAALKKLTTRLLQASYDIFYSCLKCRNLLRFCLLLVIFVSNSSLSADQSEANGESEMAEQVIAQAGAKIFAEKLAHLKDAPQENHAPAQTDLKGISLHEAFIARMDRVVENVVAVRAIHFDQINPDSGAPKPPAAVTLPEVRVFADVMAEQGPESRIYTSLIIIAGMVSSEERGKLGYQVTPEELERLPDLADQGFKVGDWLRKPPLYDKVSSAFEGGLKKLAESPELQYKLEWVIENKTLPLIDSLTEESMSLGGVVRHFSENEEFKDIENLQGKLSAFAKISYLSTVNDWAKQNGLPQLDLNRHLPQEYQEITSVAANIPAEQLQFARETVAKLSPEGKESVDKSAVTGSDTAAKELATISQR